MDEVIGHEYDISSLKLLKRQSDYRKLDYVDSMSVASSRQQNLQLPEDDNYSIKMVETEGSFI